MVGPGAVSLVAWWHLWLPAQQLRRPVLACASRQGTESDGAPGTRSRVAMGVMRQVPSRCGLSVKVHLVEFDVDNCLSEDAGPQSAGECYGHRDVDIALPGHDRHGHRARDHGVRVDPDCGFDCETRRFGHH